MSVHLLDKELPARAATALRFAAAPTFALLAVLTRSPSSDALMSLCSENQAGSILGGMSLMYLLMAGFNLNPWLRLIARSR
jgi:hypothetical protein